VGEEDLEVVEAPQVGRQRFPIGRIERDLACLPQNSPRFDQVIQRYRQIGTATVHEYSQVGRTQARLSVTGLQTAEPIGLDAIQALQAGGRNLTVSNVTAQRAFDQIYLQGGIAAVVILMGAVAIYYFVGMKPRSVDFLVATDGEMKKVNWSTRKDVIASTWVVIAASIVLAAGLFVVDILFSEFFRLIGVLDT